jgi:double-strand break repair protein AddB
MLFDGPGPRVFAMPPGADFASALVAGLRAAHDGQPPEALARLTLYLNTERMARRVRAVFDAGPACLLPRIRLVSDLADPLTRAALPAPVPPLRRRLELVGLVQRLIAAEPELAARSAAFDLADSLAALMEEMQGEGVAPDRIAALDVSDQSGHWQRALRFIAIVQRYFENEEAPDAAGLARMALERMTADWERSLPEDPVVVAGSTGSRGTTFGLMRAVARLPRGAVVLPGVDAHMPQAVWDSLADALSGEDHPQFRFARLMADLGLTRADLRDWPGATAPDPDRNAVISLALRPAPVTHQWLTEGPALPDLPQAMAHVSLIEAPGPRDEALAIGLRLRQAVEDGQSAALITPDRMLTRQVTAALDRWDIRPDDSAGVPAQLTPPGRLMRHVVDLTTGPLGSDLLLALLKHPLTHAGAGRGQHLLNTRDLELHIRRKGWAYPDAAALADWGTANDRSGWTDWLRACFCRGPLQGLWGLGDWLESLHTLACTIVAGSDAAGSDAPLWAENAGRTLARVIGSLRREAGYAVPMEPRDLADLFTAVLSREEVRDRDAGHPLVRIWGTLEARVMDADLLILGGLNEGSWPEMPGPDPWLNRRMRLDAGLLLPERRVGLSAHDFQQAAGAPEVLLSRALRNDEAETVPSRWLNRLINLMAGLPQRQGEAALEQMRARGALWRDRAALLERPIHADPAPRPSPAPPASARLTGLPVTSVKTLSRDPYAVYARRILRLKPLDPLMRPPDALLRGILAHEVMERFVRDADRQDADSLRRIAAEVIGDPQRLPYPVVRALWQARLANVADWVADTETARRARARPAAFEAPGAAHIADLGFVLTAQADRIDIDDTGGAHVYDYKTGAAPTAKQQLHFDKQLLLEAAMLERGGFDPILPGHVASATYISLAPRAPQEVPAPLDTVPAAQVWEEFETLIRRYADPAQGFTARRALHKDEDRSDYDHLSRFGEWDVTAPPRRERLQ